MVVGDHQLHTRKSSPLQGPEELLVGGLALGVCDPYAKDLPEAVVPNARDDQNAPVNHLMIHPDLLVAGVHEHVGVGLSVESTRPLQASSSESREPASCETRLFEKEVPHSSSVMSLTFLLETPPRTSP